MRRARVSASFLLPARFLGFGKARVDDLSHHQNSRRVRSLSRGDRSEESAAIPSAIEARGANSLVYVRSARSRASDVHQYTTCYLALVLNAAAMHVHRFRTGIERT